MTTEGPSLKKPMQRLERAHLEVLVRRNPHRHHPGHQSLPNNQNRNQLRQHPSLRRKRKQRLNGMAGETPRALLLRLRDSRNSRDNNNSVLHLPEAFPYHRDPPRTVSALLLHTAHLLLTVHHPHTAHLLPIAHPLLIRPNHVHLCLLMEEQHLLHLHHHLLIRWGKWHKQWEVLFLQAGAVWLLLQRQLPILHPVLFRTAVLLMLCIL